MSRTPARRTAAKKTPLKSPTTKTPSARLNTIPPAGDEGSPTPKRPTTTKRLAATLEAVSKATPKRRSPSRTLPSFDDDVFGGSPVSQETFLANERLRRQREARNFVFEGDAHAPRQTRSGRVLAEREGSYGEDAAEEARTDEDEFGEDVPPEEPMAVDEEPPAPPALVKPLAPLAQKRIVDVLATLNGRFTEAEDSEALKGLVALLSGTVERGEGNSALVTGPRGAGKTRVSCAVHLPSADPRPSMPLSGACHPRPPQHRSLSDSPASRRRTTGARSARWAGK